MANDAPSERGGSSARRREHVFILRYWDDGSASAAPAWRGLVQHVPGGERFYFSDPAALAQYVQALLVDLGPGPKTLDGN